MQGVEFSLEQINLSFFVLQVEQLNNVLWPCPCGASALYRKYVVILQSLFGLFAHVHHITAEEKSLEVEFSL
jgi:hypothetical protein